MSRLLWRHKWASAYHVAITWLARVLGKALSHFRSTRQLVSIWPEGPVALNGRVVLFSHFDRNGQVHEHVLHYVTALAKAGFSVVFVTNAGKLRPQALARLQPLCAAILIRRNIGYDFGAWKETLERLELPRSNTRLLLLVNDSVYGPLADLDPALAAIDFEKADIWSLTESWQTRYHLQSYFIAAGPAVLASPAWQGFWRQVRPIPFKGALIELYEVGLSRALISAGFRCQAVWPYTRLVTNALARPLVGTETDEQETVDPLMQMRLARVRLLRVAIGNGLPLNPTNDLWRELMTEGFPFIKRELLRDNPTHVSDLFEWREIAARLNLDIAMIEADLKRTLRNRA